MTHAPDEPPAGMPPGDEAERRSGKRLPPLPLVTTAMVAVLLGVTAVLRYTQGRASVDLAIFDQQLWNASMGAPAYSTLIRETLLEDHFSPGLLIFVPLYRLVASPLWLIGAQILAASVAVLHLAGRLRDHVGTKALAALAPALLISAPVAYALLFDFHAVVLAIPFALTALSAVEDGKVGRATLLALAAAAFRIEIGLGVAAAFLVFPGPVRPRLPGLMVLAAYLAAAFFFDAHLGHVSYWSTHYGYLGSSPIEAVTNPGRLIGALFSGSSLIKVWPWLVSSAFLCLARPRLMIPAIVAAIPVVFSRWGGTASLVFHYGAAPALLLSAAWLAVVKQGPLLVWAIVGSNVALAVVAGPLAPPALAPYPGATVQSLWKGGDLSCVTRGIPAGAAVSANPNAVSVLAHRKNLYLWPYPFRTLSSLDAPNRIPQHPDPRAAAAVSYLVLLEYHAHSAPKGFQEDRVGRLNVRFRRAENRLPVESCR